MDEYEKGSYSLSLLKDAPSKFWVYPRNDTFNVQVALQRNMDHEWKIVRPTQSVSLQVTACYSDTKKPLPNQEILTCLDPLVIGIHGTADLKFRFEENSRNSTAAQNSSRNITDHKGRMFSIQVTINDRSMARKFGCDSSQIQKITVHTCGTYVWTKRRPRKHLSAALPSALSSPLLSPIEANYSTGKRNVTDTVDEASTSDIWQIPHKKRLGVPIDDGALYVYTCM